MLMYMYTSYMYTCYTYICTYVHVLFLSVYCMNRLFLLLLLLGPVVRLESVHLQELSLILVMVLLTLYLWYVKERERGRIIIRDLRSFSLNISTVCVNIFPY